MISQHAYSNRGWLNSAQVGTTANPTSAYSLAVSYAPDGDVTRANDSANGNWQYTYDDLNRLACAGIPVCPYNSTQTEGFAYTYDQFGNRWHAQLTAGSGLNIYYTFTNGRNQIDGVTYDGAGNMTNSGTFAYNADGRLTSDGTYGLSYDGSGNMAGGPAFHWNRQLLGWPTLSAFVAEGWEATLSASRFSGGPQPVSSQERGRWLAHLCVLCKCGRRRSRLHEFPPLQKPQRWASHLGFA